MLVYQVSKSGTLTQLNYRHKQVLLPEAVCCCLQTCKYGFDIRVVLCTSVPSLIVRNTNIGINISLQVLLPEAICCCLQTCNSCMLNILVGIPLRQSFIVIGISTRQ